MLFKNSIKLLIILIIVNFNVHYIKTTAYNRTVIVEAEAKLVKKIFENYNKRLRPSDTVEIKFSLYLNQIITLIEQEQIIVLNVFLDHEWIDGIYIYYLFNIE
jgi:hypothetical protein